MLYIPQNFLHDLYYIHILPLQKKMSQCMTKGGLWHDTILARKDHYDVTAVYFSICTKSKSFEQWKIYVIEK